MEFLWGVVGGLRLEGSLLCAERELENEDATGNGLGETDAFWQRLVF